MRALGHMLLVLALASVFAAAGWKIWNQLSSSDPFESYSELKGVARSTTYEVPGSDWLEFPLLNTNGLRLLTTALVAADEAMQVDQRWGYTLGYQLLDSRGQPVKEWTYHYRTGITRFVDADTGRFQPRSYVADSQALPADSRVMQVSEVDLKGAKRLRIRLIDRQPGLQQILLRCYVREKVAENKLGFMWQRLDPVKQARIARVSVFGADFLRDQEKYNLLRWEWSPIGPAGVQGEDFRSRVLFLLNDGLGETVDEKVLPEGVYADRLTRGVLALPEGIWDLQLEVIPADSGVAAGKASPVQVRWYGKRAGEYWQVDLDYERKSPYHRESVTTGRIEVVSDQAVIVRVYLSGDGQSLMMRPLQSRLRTYVIEGSSAVEYRIEHVNDSPTPFRVDLRGLWRENESQVRSVHYQFLNQHGEMLSSGNIAVEQPLSLYDRVATPLSGERVTDPLRRYFYLPSDVATLRLSASAAVLVVGYSRPDDLTRHVRVPEDYQRISWDPASHPAWFMLRPLDHEALRLSQRSLQIVLQDRPPHIDPQIRAGRYEWRDYQPAGQWRARQLLVPRTTQQAVPDRSRAAVFSPVQHNRPVQLRIQGQSGREQVAPTLIYTGNLKEPADVAVSVDGETVASTRIFSPRSRLRLPLQPVGSQTMQIHTQANGEWWINYNGDAKDARLLRKVFQLNGKALHFDYLKEAGSEEVLTGVLYCGSPGRAKLRVTVKVVQTPDLQPRDSWTFLDRSFDIAAEPQSTVPILDTPDASVSEGQAFFLPLGEDLPAGHYRVSFDGGGRQNCYLNVHRIIAGQPLLRRFFRESDLSATGTVQ